MKVNTKRQLTTFSVFLLVYALLALVTCMFFPLEQLIPPTQTVPTSAFTIPRWLLGLVGAGIILIVYGLLGFAGYWFARKLELPTIYREQAGWRVWFLWPMLLGFGMGIILVIVDHLFAIANSSNGFLHPAFPLSVISSAAAEIGEEILFRAFVMGLWAFLLNLLLRRRKCMRAALWIGGR